MCVEFVYQKVNSVETTVLIDAFIGILMTKIAMAVIGALIGLVCGLFELFLEKSEKIFIDNDEMSIFTK